MKRKKKSRELAKRMQNGSGFASFRFEAKKLLIAKPPHPIPTSCVVMSKHTIRADFCYTGCAGLGCLAATAVLTAIGCGPINRTDTTVPSTSGNPCSIGLAPFMVGCVTLNN
jgi:hypothetical protein